MSNDYAEKLIADESLLKNKIYVIRGLQVMLDYDLAELYGYEVRSLNQQVKRNLSRFPDDFMFQLFSGQEGGRRKAPYAFTEQGIYMLATVLKGELAERQSIFIMRAFREMRHFISNNALLFEKVSNIELKQLEYQKKNNFRLLKKLSQKAFIQGLFLNTASRCFLLTAPAPKN